MSRQAGLAYPADCELDPADCEGLQAHSQEEVYKHLHRELLLRALVRGQPHRAEVPCTQHLLQSVVCLDPALGRWVRRGDEDVGGWMRMSRQEPSGAATGQCTALTF